MTYEDKYRKQALKMLKRINDTQYYFSCHKPSIGYVGEYLLRQTLQNILTSCYGVCQGFVINDDKLSRQCDIIIYIKGKESIYKSYGELKIVNAESVVAVIEVKSSITKETFLSTLEAFEQLYTLRVTNCFLFVYGKLTQRKLRNWLFSYKNSNTCTEQYIVTDSYLYD